MPITSSLVTSPPQLRIQTRHLSPGTVLITVAGEVDLATNDEFQDGLLHALVTRLPHHLEVDLDGVTFMDCGGLTALVLASQVAARTGCRLQITNPPSLLRRMLETTGLSSLLTPHPASHLLCRPRPAAQI